MMANQRRRLQIEQCGNAIGVSYVLGLRRDVSVSIVNDSLLLSQPAAFCFTLSE